MKVVAGLLPVLGLLLVSVFYFWRYLWFFRNPPRTSPPPATGW